MWERKYKQALAGWFLTLWGISIPYLAVIFTPHIPLILLGVSVWCVLISSIIFTVLFASLLWNSFPILEVRNMLHVTRNMQECYERIRNYGIPLPLQSRTTPRQ